MAKRTRLTPFAKFLLVMVFVAPLAYIGASYYNGQDGVANIKTLLGIESSAEDVSTKAPIEQQIPAKETETAASEPVTYSNDQGESVADLRAELENIKLRMQQIEAKIQALESRSQ